MNSIPLEELLAGARLLCRLPYFLRHPITSEEARETLRRRLEHRQADFLALIRKTIYEYRASPYLKLLKLARWSGTAGSPISTPFGALRSSPPAG